MNIMFRIIIAILFVSNSFMGFSQEVRIYHQFDEFEPILKSKSDTTYVINFWATWCKPCVKEMPYFLEVNEKFRNEKFRMVLVSLDFDAQLESRVKPFIKEHSIEPEVVLLADSKQHSWIDKVNPDWTGSIPMTIIYHKDFYFFREGSLNLDELNEIITKNIIK